MFHSTIVGTVGRVCARNVPPSVRPSPTLVWTHPPGSVTSASKKLTNRKLLRHTRTYTHTYLCYFGVSPGLLAKMLLRRMMTTAVTCLWNISKALWLMSHRYTHTTPIHILLMVVICSLPFSPSLPLTPFPSPSPSHIPQAPPASDPNVQLQEEDDLQLAIAMSLNEQENKVT